MTTTSTKSLLTLAAAAVALSMAAAAPAQARSGDLVDKRTRGYSQTQGADAQARARQHFGRQTASDRSLFSDARTGAVVVYDLEASGNGIARRKWVRD